MIDTYRPSFTPDWASPPGDTISDILQERGWTQAELADRLGYTTKHVSQLVNGKATITEDTAVRLERVLGGSTSFWLTREAQYRAQRGALEGSKRLEGWSDWCAKLPVRELMDAEVITKRRLGSENQAQIVEDLLQFFRVASPTEWTRRYAAMEPDYRRAGSGQADVGAVSAWLRLGEIEAERLDGPPYERSRFEDSLKEIRTLLAQEPRDFRAEIQDLCRDAGVVFAVVPEINRAQVTCAARWLSPHRPLIQLSTVRIAIESWRYAFFHEAAHILFHDKKAVFLDSFSGEPPNSHEEAQAHAWAGSFIRGDGKVRTLATH